MNLAAFSLLLFQLLNHFFNDEPDKLAIVFTRILISNTADVTKLFTEREKKKFMKVFPHIEKNIINTKNRMPCLFIR